MKIEVVFNFHELQQEPLVNFAEMKDQKLYFHKEGADKYAGLYQEARKNFGIRAGNIYFCVRDRLTNWNKCSLFIQYWSWNNEIELSIGDGEKMFSKVIKPNCPSNEYYLTDDIMEEVEGVFKKRPRGKNNGDDQVEGRPENEKGQ